MVREVFQPTIRFVISAALMSAALSGCDPKNNRSDSASSSTEKSFSSPGGDRQTSSYLIESVIGAPENYSNASSLEITVVKRNEDSLVKWKVANGGKIQCLSDEGWSEKTAEQTLTIDLSSLADGEAWMCLRAESLDGVRDSNPIILGWLHDITPPAAPSKFSITSPQVTKSTSRSVVFNWIPGQDVDPDNGAPASLLKEQLIMVGTTEGGSDIMTASYGLTEYAATITLPRDGDFYFSIAAIDNAGNTSVKNIANRYSFDNTPPTPPTSITWSKTGPTNDPSNITISWPAAEEDTEVYYVYKIGTSAGADNIQQASTTSATQVTLTLSDTIDDIGGTYNAYVSIQAVNSVLIESNWEAYLNFLEVDTDAPIAAIVEGSAPTEGVNYGTNLTINPNSTSPSNNFNEYRYKIVAGNDCAITTPSWSEWIDANTQTPLSIPGPAYETELSICMNVRDAAGNVNAPTNYNVANWNNYEENSPGYSETASIKFYYQVDSQQGQTLNYSYQASNGMWQGSETIDNAAPDFNPQIRTRTGVDGTVYTASPVTLNGNKDVKITRSINGTVKEGGEQLLASVPIDSTNGGSGAAAWCDGDLHLLDLALDASDELLEGETEANHSDQFHVLVACVKPNGTQQVRAISFDEFSRPWTHYEIANLQTTTPAIGAIAARDSNLFFSFADPADQFKVKTCSVLGSCETNLSTVEGSQNTTAMAAIFTSNGKRIVVSGTDLDTTRIGVIDHDTDTNTNVWALRWLIREIPNPSTFVLNPYIEDLSP